MNQVVERAAKAAHEKAREIALSWGGPDYGAWDELPDKAKRAAIECQRAAIEALRDADDLDMKIAGKSALFLCTAAPKLDHAGICLRMMLNVVLRD